MEQILNIIPIYYTSKEINGLLKKSKGIKADYSLHFTQNEDFFLIHGRHSTYPRSLFTMI